MSNEVEAWKVETSIWNGQNGGTSYFRTEEEALAYIDRFKKNNDGWTSTVSDPEECMVDESELDE